jgi:hypothetical protein
VNNVGLVPVVEIEIAAFIMETGSLGVANDRTDE